MRYLSVVWVVSSDIIKLTLIFHNHSVVCQYLLNISITHSVAKGNMPISITADYANKH